jgi:hypothetical protein
MLKAFGLVGICCYANLPNELQADGPLPAHHVDRPVCRVPVSVSVSVSVSGLYAEFHF